MPAEGSVNRIVHDLISELRAGIEAEALDSATGWIVCCRDENSGRIDFWSAPDGRPFAEPAAAAEAAVLWQEELNRGVEDDPEEKGWTCYPAPLLPLSERTR